MKSPLTILCEIASRLNWGIYVCKEQRYVDLSWRPTSDEDFSFAVQKIDTFDNIFKEVSDYAFYFDPEEHTAMWLEAKKSGTGGIPDIRTLLESADEIAEKLDELSDALIRFQLKGEMPPKQ